jgi:hypothetical protein
MRWYTLLILILATPFLTYLFSYLWHHAQMSAWISKFNEYLHSKKSQKNEEKR